MTRPASTTDELNSDRDALDLVNSDDMLDATLAMFISHFYLENQFWPQLRKMMEYNPNTPVQPFAKMHEIINHALPQIDTKQWLEKYNLLDKVHKGAHPTLKQRMDNLGLSNIKLPTQLKQSAAHCYLNRSLKLVTNHLDQHWLSSNGTIFFGKHIQNAYRNTKITSSPNPLAPNAVNPSHQQQSHQRQRPRGISQVC